LREQEEFMSRKKSISLLLLLIFFGFSFLILRSKNKPSSAKLEVEASLKLPAPHTKGKTSVEEALSKRRSVRTYKKEPLTIEQLSQLCWAAQGITSEEGGRTAPSAGAKYPLEVFLVVGNVDGLDPGVYHYNPFDHSLTKKEGGDKREKLRASALGQKPLSFAPVSFVITGIYERTMVKYGERGIRYVHIEVGHVCQNIYLQAEALDLGTVVIGAFEDQKIKKLLNLKEEAPLALMPVGRKK